MLSRERLDEIRRMTPAERLRITAAMIRAGVRDLLSGPPELLSRRFEVLRRQNDERTRNIVEGLLRAERRHG